MSVVTAGGLGEQKSQEKIEIEKLAAQLRRAGSCEDIVLGRRVHARILQSRYRNYRYLANLVVEMYGDCHSVSEARAVFDGIEKPNVFSWNTMLGAYGQNGQVEDAKQIFNAAPEKNLLLWTTLISAYARNGHLEEAKSTFDGLPESDVVTQTTILLAFLETGNLEAAESIYISMPVLDTIGWTIMLKAYAERGHLQKARRFFELMPEMDVVSATSMVVAYAENSDLEDAKAVFDSMPQRNIVSWTAMVKAYACEGDIGKAKPLFDRMPEHNVISFTAMLQAYLDNGKLQLAKAIFDAMPERDVIAWNSMVQGYAKMGYLEEAKLLVDRMPRWNTVTWTALVEGYAQSGYMDEARSTFDRMPGRDMMAWNSMIGTYAQLGYMHEAKEIFAMLPERDVFSWTAMIPVHARGGSVYKAKMVFDTMPQQNVVSWNAMVASYAHCGHAKSAVELFKFMEQEGLRPNDISFVSLLTACSRLGALDEGHGYFLRMVLDYCVAPLKEHYSSMLDLLGRAGRLRDAEELVKTMPFVPDSVMWATLLGACKLHKDTARGQRAAKQIINLDTKSCLAYVLLGNICVERSEQLKHQVLLPQARPARSLVAPPSVLPHCFVGLERHLSDHGFGLLQPADSSQQADDARVALPLGRHPVLRSELEQVVEGFLEQANVLADGGDAHERYVVGLKSFLLQSTKQLACLGNLTVLRRHRDYRVPGNERPLAHGVEDSPCLSRAPALAIHVDERVVDDHVREETGLSYAPMDDPGLDEPGMASTGVKDGIYSSPVEADAFEVHSPEQSDGLSPSAVFGIGRDHGVVEQHVLGRGCFEGFRCLLQREALRVHPDESGRDRVPQLEGLVVAAVFDTGAQHGSPGDNVPVVLDALEDDLGILQTLALSVRVDEAVRHRDVPEQSCRTDLSVEHPDLTYVGETRIEAREERHSIRLGAFELHRGEQLQRGVTLSVLDVCRRKSVPGDEILLLHPVEGGLRLLESRAPPVHSDQSVPDRDGLLDSTLGRTLVSSDSLFQVPQARAAIDDAHKSLLACLDAFLVHPVEHLHCRFVRPALSVSSQERVPGEEILVPDAIKHLEHGEKGDFVGPDAFVLHGPEELEGLALQPVVSVGVDDRVPGRDALQGHGIEELLGVADAAALAVHVDERVPDEDVGAVEAILGGSVVDHPQLAGLLGGTENTHESHLVWSHGALVLHPPEHLQRALAVAVLRVGPDDGVPGHNVALLHPLEDAPGLLHSAAVAIHAHQRVRDDHIRLELVRDDHGVDLSAVLQALLHAAAAEQAQVSHPVRLHSLVDHPLEELQRPLAIASPGQHRDHRVPGHYILVGDALEHQLGLVQAPGSSIQHRVEELQRRGGMPVVGIRGHDHRPGEDVAVEDPVEDAARVLHSAELPIRLDKEVEQQAIGGESGRGEDVAVDALRLPDVDASPDERGDVWSRGGFAVVAIASIQPVQLPVMGDRILRCLSRTSIAMADAGRRSRGPAAQLPRRALDEDPVDGLDRFGKSSRARLMGIAEEMERLPLEEAIHGLEMLGFSPGVELYAALLRRCGSQGSLAEGIRVHEHIARSKLVRVRFLENTLMEMYGRCGGVQEATAVFERMEDWNVYSWTIIIAANTQNGHPLEALQLFYRMNQEGTAPNNHTLSIAIAACSALVDLSRGRKIHASLEGCGFQADDHVKNTLMDFYTKCDSLDDVKKVFRSMGGDAKVVSWTCLIVGCVQLGSYREAFHFFKLMELQGIHADTVTYASLLDACSNLASLSQGRKLHARIAELGLLEADVVLQTSILTMYSKCGRLGEARGIFDRIGEKNIVAWSAIIIAYAQNGDCSTALKLFWKMEQAGQKASETTFVSVLYACSHAGLVDDAYYYFTTMMSERKLEPLPGHYGCIVDLLGRAGRLADAEELIQRMKAPHSGVLWTTLLGACKTHGDMMLAERAAERIRELDPGSATPYVLLSNVYSEAGRWDLAASVRKRMDNMKVKKPAGKSWVEVRGKLHEFVAGDQSHPKIGEIVLELKRLLALIKEAGYAADKSATLHNAEEEEKEGLLYYHSEKLAIVMGLLHSPRGEPVQVVKNLRVCSDCHAAAKFISKVVDRQIVLRDTKQFHHFEHGRCSCGDYW
ncbi:uncharacterized protein LOC9640691 [Selaginella moellendorffii]|nr:uncharacterized protein LOC9640691 [Selaginella moellendorffii]|eukprot:XP_002971845.2 uncharacterized protein LOC9640691 [Selaginella moellendorffii]